METNKWERMRKNVTIDFIWTMLGLVMVSRSYDMSHRSSISAKVILRGNRGGSLKIMASSMSIGICVATITIPPFFLCSAMMYSSNLTPSSSNATEGSSSSQIGLSIANNLASCRRLRCPIDNIFAFSFANLPSPISSMAGIDLPCFPSSTSNHWTLSMMVKFSLMASLSESQFSWSLYWWNTPDSVMSCPFHRILPAEGRENPANIRKNVVLPEPLVPDSTSALPSWIETLTFLRICWAFRIQDTWSSRSRGSGGPLRDIVLSLLF